MDDDLGTPVQKTRSSLGKKAGVFFIVAVAVLLVYFKFGHLLSLEGLATQESQLRAYQAEHPVLVFGAAFLVYVLATGLSLPGAAALTLVYGWYFGFARGLVLVSFASTAGATMAFLLSRFLFRDAIQNRFGQRLESFNRSLEKEGALFPVHFTTNTCGSVFVINAVMGLTPIRTRTFWWVSQVGMLAGTVIYVYAGSSVPDLQTLADKGIGAVFTPSQLVKLAIAFALLGLFPLAVRYAMKFFTVVDRWAMANK